VSGEWNCEEDDVEDLALCRAWKALTADTVHGGMRLTMIDQAGLAHAAENVGRDFRA
jgi:acyl-CoA hydrolase